jgi:hypothetical protein
MFGWGNREASLSPACRIEVLRLRRSMTIVRAATGLPTLATAPTSPGSASPPPTSPIARSCAAILDRAENSDDDALAAVGQGMPDTSMPAFAARLGEDARWAVVGFLPTLSLQGAPGAAAGSLEPDRAA